MTERIRQWLKTWLEVPTSKDICEIAEMKADNEVRCSPTTTELKQRIQDLEEAYPGYKDAKEEADKKVEPLIQGFVPFSQRKKQFEATHRKQK